MNKHRAILIFTGALALFVSACLWESEDDADAGRLGGASGGNFPGFTGGSGPGTGSTGGGGFFRILTDGGVDEDGPDGAVEGASSGRE